MRVAVVFKRDRHTGRDGRFAAKDSDFPAGLAAIQIPDNPQAPETRNIFDEPKRVLVVGKRRERNLEPTGDPRHPRDERMGDTADFIFIDLDVVSASAHYFPQN